MTSQVTDVNITRLRSRGTDARLRCEASFAMHQFPTAEMQPSELEPVLIPIARAYDFQILSGLVWCFRYFLDKVPMETQDCFISKWDSLCSANYTKIYNVTLWRMSFSTGLVVQSSCVFSLQEAHEREKPCHSIVGRKQTDSLVNLGRVPPFPPFPLVVVSIIRIIESSRV